MRKPQLIEAIEKCGALEDEISGAWEEIEKPAEKAEQNAAEEGQRAEKAEQSAAEERQRPDQKEAAERREREEQRAHKLKLK